MDDMSLSNRLGHGKQVPYLPWGAGAVEEHPIAYTTGFGEVITLKPRQTEGLVSHHTDFFRECT